MLCRVQLLQLQRLTLLYIRQDGIFLLARCWHEDTGIAVEAYDTTFGIEFEVAGRHGDKR